MAARQQDQASEAYDAHLQEIIAGMRHWLELFDSDFAHDEVPLPQRPLKALIHLLTEGAVEIRFDDTTVVSKPHEHTRSAWFSVLYEAVLSWYGERFGTAAMKGGVPPLAGAVLIHNSAFALAVPSNRRTIEVEGEKAWFHFEDELHASETAAEWIVDGPDLAAMDATARQSVLDEAHEVAGTLRYLDFRRLTANPHDEAKAAHFVVSMMTYLQEAARRIVGGRTGDRGPAWFDLQMARESALKAVIAQASGSAPHSHDLMLLLGRAADQGVTFDYASLSNWPDFKTMSDWRYGQGQPFGLDRLYAAYRVTLDLARAAMAAYRVGLEPGFAFLMQYPPWQPKR